MKTTLTKLLCGLLCLLMLTCAFAACKDNDVPQNTKDPNKDTDQGGDPDSNLDENGYEKDSINVDLGKRTMRMLVYNAGKDMIFPEESTEGADLIVDAVYSRNLDLEDRLNVVLDPTYVPAAWGERTTFMEVAEKCGENKIDIVATYSLWPALMLQKGLLTNLKNLTYPELEKPWWPDSIKDYEQGGGLYFVHNNSSLMSLKEMEVIFYNTAMIEDYGLQDPAELVVENQWTLDTMLTYAKNVESNTDVPEDSRIYALVVDEVSRIDMFYHGADIKTIENVNGDLQLTFMESAAKERAVTLVEKLGTLAAYDTFKILQNNIDPMKESRTMFFAGYMQMISRLEDNKDYAVVPTPMFNEEQGRYRVIMTNAFDVWCIPSQAADKEASGVVIEAFASSDYRTLAPAYYDKNLKYRYSTSSLGVEVFDLIRASVKCDFARINTASLDTLEGPFRWCFWDYSVPTTKYNNQYVSKLQNMQTEYMTTLQKLLQDYSKYA